jgi:hypothetical protein
VNHLTLAARAEGGVVDIGGHDSLGDEHDVFLDVGGLAADARVGRALAVGADQRGLDVDVAVNVLWNFSRPRRMSLGLNFARKKFGTLFDFSAKLAGWKKFLAGNFQTKS